SSTRDCLAAVAELWGWDADYFGQMYNDAAERDFVFTGVSKASWSDPTSQFRVRVAFNWLLDAIELSALLFKNRSRNELIRKPLGSMVPESGQLRNALTKEHGRWVSPTEFELCTSDFMQKRWSVSF